MDDEEILQLVEQALIDAHKYLKSNVVPASRPEYDYCAYYEANEL